MRYRFYEAMSMARVPVLLCDHCVLPFSDRINYARCVIQIRESSVPGTGFALREWLNAHSDAEILEMGVYGRAMWERWLAGAQWERVWGEIVKERLAQ